MRFIKLATLGLFTSLSFSTQANNPYDIYAQAHYLEPKISNRTIDKNKVFLDNNERKIFLALGASELMKDGPNIAIKEYISSNYKIKYPSDYTGKDGYDESTQRSDWVILSGRFEESFKSNSNQYKIVDKYNNSAVIVTMKKENAFFNNNSIKPGKRADLFCQEHRVNHRKISLTRCVGFMQFKKDLYKNMTSYYDQYNTFESVITWHILTNQAKEANETVSFYNPAPYIYYAKNMSLNGFKCKDNCLKHISSEYKKMIENGEFKKVITYMKRNYN